MIHSFIIHLIHSFFVRISENFKEHKLSLDVCGLTLVIPIEVITPTDSLYEVSAQDVNSFGKMLWKILVLYYIYTYNIYTPFR